MSTGPAATPPPAPPAPPAGTPPAGAPGPASQRQPGNGNVGIWGRFPNVPAEHREMLEPHLKGVQAHVTRLEQQLAPFKGMTPQTIAGIANFARQFDANPKAMFLAMAADLQRRGHIHESLDLEALQAVIDGVDPDEGAEIPGGEEGDPWEGAPAWALELRQFQESQKEKEQSDARARQEKIEDTMLSKSLEKMKASLKQAGYPEDYLTDARLTAQLLTHGGNAQVAIQDAIDGRNQILGTIVKPKPGDEEVTMPHGSPRSSRPKQPSDGLKKRDPIKAAGAGAEQFLRKAAQDAQQ